MVQSPSIQKTDRYLDLMIKNYFIYIYILWRPIDPIGTIRIGKGWAYGPIPNPRIRKYPMTTSKRRNENCTLRRGKEYLWRT